MLTAFAAGCGGGDHGGSHATPAPGPTGWVVIKGEYVSDETPDIAKLWGTAHADPDYWGVDWNGNLETGISVTWKNNTTGESGSASTHGEADWIFGQPYNIVTAWNASIPLESGLNHITITASGRGMTGVASRGVSGPSPTAPSGDPMISRITPTFGSEEGGTIVTIKGAHFVDGASVEMDFEAAFDVIVVDSETVTFTTPPHSARSMYGGVSVDVTVINPDGRVGEVADGFVFVNHGWNTYAGTPKLPVPEVVAVSPGSGSVEGGTQVVVNGWGFLSQGGYAYTAIYIGGGTYIDVLTATQAVCVTKPYPYEEAVDVYARNPNQAFFWTGDDGMLPEGFTFVP